MSVRVTAATRDGLVILKTPYACKDICRGLPGAVWSPAEYAWTYPASPRVAARILETFPQLVPDDGFKELLEFNARADSSQHLKTALDLPPIPNVKTKPWLHQLQAFWFAYQLRACMLALYMGLGKSKVTVDLICNRDDFKVLILAPLSVVNVWPGQFARHAAAPVVIAPLDSAYNGTLAKTRAAVKALGVASARGVRGVVVCNYESAWRAPFEGFALSMDWDLIVLDESHRIKAPGGTASKFCAKLGLRAKRRLCLTGTPMPHSPLDAYAQYRFLDPGIFGSNFAMFKAHYAIVGGFENREVIAYRNQEELNRKFYAIAFRATKDAIELPPSMHEQRTFPLSGEARRVYDALKADLIAEVKTGEVNATNALVRLLRLSQITGGWVTPDGRPPERIDTGKEDTLADLLEDMDPAEPVAVFCRFLPELDTVHSVAQTLERESLELSGRVNQLQSWQKGSAPILAVQIQAGGVGIDLTRARYAVYFSVGYSLGDYDQSLSRVHRPGQDRPVTYYHLIAEDTVDEQVYEALDSRKEVVEHVLGTLSHETPAVRT